MQLQAIMNKLLISSILGIISFSCGNSVEETGTSEQNKCDCLYDYEIMMTSYAEVENSITCLEAEGIVVSLENENTMELISEMDLECPKESRKFWKLCKNLDEGIIIKP